MSVRTADPLPPRLEPHRKRYEEILAKLERDEQADPSRKVDPDQRAYFARRLLEQWLGDTSSMIDPARRIPSGEHSSVVATPQLSLQGGYAPSPSGRVARLLGEAVSEMHEARIVQRRRGGTVFALGKRDEAHESAVAFAEPDLKVPQVLRHIASALEIVPRPDVARFYMPDGHTAFLDLSLTGIRPRLEVRRVDVPTKPRKVPRPFSHELRVRVYREADVGAP